MIISSADRLLRRQRQRPRPRLMLAAAGLAILATTGCADPSGSTSAAQQAGGDRAAVPAPIAVTTVEQVIRPIDAYELDAAQTVAVEYYRLNTEADCIAAAGYDRPNLIPNGYDAMLRAGVEDRAGRSDTYGFFDTVNVDKYGYTRPPDTPGWVELTNSVPGVPDAVTNKCASTARTATTGTSPDELPSQGPRLADNDPSVAIARQAWASCMSQHGLDTTDPVNFQYDHATTSPDDLAIARTDVGCKRQTNFVGIALAAQTAVDDAYIAANLPALTKARQRLDQVLAVVR